MNDKRGVFALFALPQIPHNLALLPAINFIPAFYSQNLALPIAMVGAMLFLSRITDIFTDPLIGIASDRTRSRYGRRRPFILIGLPIVCTGVWLAFVPPDGAGLAWLFWALFIMYLGFTLIDIPYASWAAELSTDYDERTTITAWKGAFTAVGALIAVAIPVVLEAFGRTGAGPALFWMAVFYVIAQPLTFLLMMRSVPEPLPEALPIKRPGFLKGLAIVFSNGPFVRIFLALVLGMTGMVIGATLNLIFITHVIDAPGAFPIMIFLQNFVMLISIPIVTWISKRLEKHIVVMVGLFWIAACLALTYLWESGDTWPFVATIVALGFGLGALIALAPAMIADVTDQDILRTGEERTALFFSVLGFGQKTAIAIGVLLGTALPALVGFEPSDTVLSSQALNGLRLIYAFSGLPLLAIGIFALAGYSLTRARVTKLRADIASKANM